MPELPDVEFLIRGIRDKVREKKINRVNVLLPRSIHFPSVAEFKRRLQDNTFLGLNRRGKFLLFPLQSKDTLVMHLRMTGNLTLCSSQEPIHPHARVIFSLADNEDLRFTDMRKLGTIHLVPDENFSYIPLLLEMGPEPLSNDFAFSSFEQLLEGRRGMIKPLLLNQRFIAGIGNIYGDEILFQARIHPKRRVESLSKKEIKRLYKCIKKVLQIAVDGYTNLVKREDFILNFREEGESCPRCNVDIEVVEIAGRHSYFCPRCQKI